MSSFLGTLTISSGTQQIFNAPNQGVKAILIGNESGLTVTVTMQSGGVQKTLYPSTLDWFTVNPGFTGNILVNPQTILNNASNFPASELLFDAIGLGDTEQASMYPITLNRATNVGNTVNTTSTASNSILNTTNAAGTQWIDVQPTDAASATITADNSGNLTWKGDNSGTLTTLLQLIAGASPAVKIAAAAVLTEALGNLKVDGTLESVGNATMDGTLQVTGKSTLGVVEATGAATLDSTLLVTGDATFNGTGNGVSVAHNLSVAGSSSLDNGALATDGSGNITTFGGTLQLGASDPILSVTSGNTRLQCKSSGSINFQIAAGTSICYVDSTGLHLNSTGSFDLAGSGTFKYRNGNTMQAISSFTGTGSGTYNHNFSSSPFMVIPIVDTSGSATQGYDTITSTQVHITLGSSLAFRAWCWA